MGKATSRPGVVNPDGKKGDLFARRRNFRAPIENYWSDISAEKIKAAIDTVTRYGGAVMFGLTRDGGAYSLMVLADDDKIREYPHGIEDCEQLLIALSEEFTN